jgi:fructose/tagatose bisphosphate aldolase
MSSATLYKSVENVKPSLEDIANLVNGKLKIVNQDKFRSLAYQLAYNSVFNADEKVRDLCCWLIRAGADLCGLRLASIHDLYMARGRGECKGFTVPAINIRGMTFDVASQVFNAAMKNKVGPFIFEIARSEIGYTLQRPLEYATVVVAAGLATGYKGPLFIQGDHYQVNAKKYKADADNELGTIRDLIVESLDAGFLNIDIDASTVVDLSKPTEDEQQETNAAITHDLTVYIRDKEPSGVTVSIGGEIGEVGGKNSTVEDLRGFVGNYNKKLKKSKAGTPGLSKISIQTGTTHGGVPLPDGTVAKVKVDFDTLEKLSKVAREEYGMAGAVQHGASTLPEEAFDLFPKKETAEIHLATGFQNIIYDHEAFPEDLRQTVYGHLKKECANERKEGQTDEQFYYTTRKKGFGPFKKEMWDLPVDVKRPICQKLEDQFDFLFKKLAVGNTEGLTKKHIKPVSLRLAVPELAQKVLSRSR